MQCILYKIYFWKVFHMYYNLICILYALLCGQNFILVKSGCYITDAHEDLSENLLVREKPERALDIRSSHTPSFHKVSAADQ
jgi:hypothetical protein